MVKDENGGCRLNAVVNWFPDLARIARSLVVSGFSRTLHHYMYIPPFTPIVWPVM